VGPLTPCERISYLFIDGLAPYPLGGEPLEAIVGYFDGIDVEGWFGT
jgi:hypothetical protein